MECGVAGIPEGTRGNPALLAVDNTDPFPNGIDQKEFFCGFEFFDRDHAFPELSLREQVIPEHAGQQSAFDRWCEEFAIDLDHDVRDRRFCNLTSLIPEDKTISPRSPRGLMK